MVLNCLTSLQDRRNKMLKVHLDKRHNSIGSNSNFNLKSPRQKANRKSKSDSNNEDIFRSTEARNSISPASNDLFGGRATSVSEENSNIDNEPNLNAINEYIESVRSNLESMNPIDQNNQNNIQKIILF